VRLSSLSLPEIGVPTICTDIYRDQTCTILCRNGWYFSGTRSCTCKFGDGSCKLSSGECKRCPQLNNCGVHGVVLAVICHHFEFCLTLAWFTLE
jgi:hypothetical protein